jgi:NAD(P)-dependent dehydrogenase (short-subunit alcohol dehydrogenase family)
MTERSKGLFDLTGQVVVITGSTRGIGRAIAARMVEHGARVVVSGRKPDAVTEARDELAAGGGEVLGAVCDIARRDHLERLVAAALDRWGRIDTLVCNAAVSPFFGPSRQMPDEAFARVMDCNVRSNVWLTNAVVPGMAERGGGSVIIVSSIGGLRGSTHLGAYAISKAADMQLARNIAVEWGPRNVRANCIAPGLVRTDFARALWADPDVLRRRVKDTPLQRIGEPDEIAGAAVFLASSAGSYTTGHCLTVDGGVLAGSPWQTAGG